MDAQLQQRILAKIKECFRKGNRQFKAKAKLDRLTLSKTLTAKWGVAGYNPRDGYYIRLSADAVQSDPEYVINEIIPHEVAHVIGYWLKHNELPYGDTGHGESWRTIAMALGSDGSVNGKPRTAGRYKYQADNGDIVRLTPDQHNAIQNEYRVLRTASGGRLTAASYMGAKKR